MLKFHKNILYGVFSSILLMEITILRGGGGGVGRKSNYSIYFSFTFLFIEYYIITFEDNSSDRYSL